MKLFTFFKIQYILPAVFFFFLTVLQAQNTDNLSKIYVDSLEKILLNPSLSNDEKCEKYYYAIIDDIETYQETAMELVWKGLRFVKKTNNHLFIALFYYQLGYLHFYAMQLDSALYYHDLSFDMMNQAEKRGVKKKEFSNWLPMRLFSLMGDIHDANGRYDMALENYFKALKIAEEQMDPEEEALLCGKIGSTYLTLTNFPKVELYFLRQEQICSKLDNPVGLANSKRDLCKIYKIKNDYEKALEYVEEAYRILSELPDVTPLSLMNIALELTDLWHRIPDYDKALKYALENFEYAKQSGVPYHISVALYNLSKCYLKLKRYSEAEEVAFQALQIDSSVVLVNSQIYGCIAIANIYLKNSDKAYKYFGKTVNAINEYSNENYQSSIAEMEVQYETEKKEMEIAALKEEKRLTNRLIFAVGGALLLGLISIIFLWRFTVQKRRIAEQQKQIAEQQVKQLEQEKQLVATQAVFDGEVQERTRIARDLHDGLGGKLTCMKLGLQELKQIAEIDDNKDIHYKTVMDALNDSVQELRRVSHNLMPETLNQSGLKVAVDEFCRSMSPKITFNYYGDETRLDINLEVQIYRCIYELVNNALKYADATQILVQIVQESDTLSFTVQDNGCGFDPTAETEGMGLQNIRARVASVGGDIHIDSKVGEGTEVNIDFRF